MKLRSVQGPVHTETQSFHFVPYYSEEWNAEGLRSDGNALKRTVPFQKMERLKSDTESGTIRNRSVPFPYELADGEHVNGTIAFPSEHKTKLVRNPSVPVSTRPEMPGQCENFCTQSKRKPSFRKFTLAIFHVPSYF